MVPRDDKVAARMINPEPVTPADPLEVNIKTASTINWSVRVNGVLVAWAMKIAAMV
ncbi:hypothetical protein D3C78_1793030 [compost metagenome]